MEELTWTEEEEESTEHPYYNNIPGKMPPPGGFIDTRLSSQTAATDGCQVEPITAASHLNNDRNKHSCRFIRLIVINCDPK